MNHLKPLKTIAEIIPWKEDDPFHYHNMIRIRTISGPSSFLHAIFNAFFMPYRSNQFNGEMFNRHEFIQTFREKLAYRLLELAEPEQSKEVRVYDTLCKGKNKEIASAIKSYTIEVMQSELLDKDFFLDDKYLELISNEINKDIYILNGLTNDVWVKTEDTDLFYKNRGTIVIIAFPAHFETVGVLVGNSIDTDIKYHFDPTSNFVEALKTRYEAVKKNT